jgi:hypothetical protein
MPSIFTVSGAPVTTTGTIAVSLNTASAYNVFGNCTNSVATPAFCPLTAAMIPSTLNSTQINGLTVNGNETVSGTLGVTGAATLSSTLGVTGNATIGGTLGVTGTANLSSGGALTGTFSGNPTFSGIPIFGTANFTTGIELGGSFGTAGYSLISTGSGTTFVSPIGGTPTIACGAGAGAGSGAACTFYTGSTDKAGAVSVVTGTTPSGPATVATVTFSSPFSINGFCTFSLIEGNTTQEAYITMSAGNASFGLVNQGSALSGLSTYVWTYSCNGH